MNKTQLLSRIAEIVDDSIYFTGKSIFTIHHDSSKYDVLAVHNDDGEITLECVGYSSFSLKSFTASLLSTLSIGKILKHCKTYLGLDYDEGELSKMLDYHLTMFGLELDAKVERHKRRHGEGVKVLLFAPSGEMIHEYYSYLSGQDAAISAICDYHKNILAL